MVLCLPSRSFDEIPFKVHYADWQRRQQSPPARHSHSQASNRQKQRSYERHKNRKELERDLLIHILSEFHTILRFQTQSERNQNTKQTSHSGPPSWSSFAAAGFHRPATTATTSISNGRLRRKRRKKEKEKVMSGKSASQKKRRIAAAFSSDRQKEQQEGTKACQQACRQASTCRLSCRPWACHPSCRHEGADGGKNC